jgi:(2Fe-2S) ferredoxin
MSNQQQKRLLPLTGYFLGWGDDCTPHRYLKLATTNGEQRVKVAKNLRPQIQSWQPGIWLNLVGSERIDRSTGATKIKVKQLLTLPHVDPASTLGDKETVSQSIECRPVELTKIRVCQGSSCRRRGSEQICKSMQTYLARHELTKRVQIETVKCLHQCKAAPHAIVTSPTSAILPGKIHYRQLQSSQVPAILAKHFPLNSSSKSTSFSLIEKIGDYLQKHQISVSIPIS